MKRKNRKNADWIVRVTETLLAGNEVTVDNFVEWSGCKTQHVCNMLRQIQHGNDEVEPVIVGLPFEFVAPTGEGNRRETPEERADLAAECLAQLQSQLQAQLQPVD